MAMHLSLSDRYKLKAKLSEAILLTASVIFLSVTFAETELYEVLGLAPDKSKIILGITSVISFIFSLILLLQNWPGKAFEHKDSADKWKVVINEFRDSRKDDGEWSTESFADINNAYLDALKYSINVPDKIFNKLKKEYLAKVEESKLISNSPGLPLFIVKGLVIYRALLKWLLG